MGTGASTGSFPLQKTLYGANVIIFEGIMAFADKTLLEVRAGHPSARTPSHETLTTFSGQVLSLTLSCGTGSPVLSNMWSLGVSEERALPQEGV